MEYYCTLLGIFALPSNELLIACNQFHEIVQVVKVLKKAKIWHIF